MYVLFYNLISTNLLVFAIYLLSFTFLIIQVDNCGDGSDENNHDYCDAQRNDMCIMGQFKCANKQCIEGSSVCDDIDDCGDATDEIGCHKQSN